DNLQPLRGGDDARRHLRRRPDREAVVALDDLEELVRFQSRPDINIDAAGGEDLRCHGRKLVADQNGGHYGPRGYVRGAFYGTSARAAASRSAPAADGRAGPSAEGGARYCPGPARGGVLDRGRYGR